MDVITYCIQTGTQKGIQHNDSQNVRQTDIYIEADSQKNDTANKRLDKKIHAESDIQHTDTETDKQIDRHTDIYTDRQSAYIQ